MSFAPLPLMPWKQIKYGLLPVFTYNINSMSYQPMLNIFPTPKWVYDTTYRCDIN